MATNNDGIRGFALNAIMNSMTPQQRSSPQMQGMINAIQSNDSATGERLADNICRSYGLTREQMLQKVMRDLGL